MSKKFQQHSARKLSFLVILVAIDVGSMMGYALTSAKIEPAIKVVEPKIQVQVILVSVPPYYTPMELAKKRIEHIKITNFYSYANDMSNSDWEAGGDQKHCYLIQKIPHYGEIGFHRVAGQDDSFWVRSWQGLRMNAPINFYTVTPSWQESSKSMFLGEALLESNDPLVKVDSTLSQQLLKELKEGYYLKLEYAVPDAPQNGIRIMISPIRFQKGLAQYMECQRELLPYAYKEVEKIILYFPAKSTSVETEFKPLLDKIIRYYQAGAKIEKILVEGHTDSAGFYELNRRVSLARADAIKNYLKENGIPDKLIELKPVGAAEPMASNATAHGRAKNRRVVVKLFVKE